MTEITPVAADELDEVLDLIAAEQAHPDRGTTMLGEKRDGIAAELGDVEPDWTASVRVAREDGRIVGAVVGDWDPDLGRAWILGPWVVGDDDAWRRWARPLVDSVLEQLPEGIDDWELAADASHVRMAELGAELGLPASEVSHVYSVDAATVGTWPEPSGEVRPATHADVETHPSVARPGVPRVVRHRRPPGPRDARRQVPGRRRGGRSAAPRVRRRAGPARRRGLPRLHRRRGRRPRPGRRAGPDGRASAAR